MVIFFDDEEYDVDAPKLLLRTEAGTNTSLPTLYAPLTVAPSAFKVTATGLADAAAAVPGNAATIMIATMSNARTRLDVSFFIFSLLLILIENA